MGYKQTVAPIIEPVTLAQAKAWLRTEVSADDDLVTSLIISAREQVEVLTNRQLINATWQLTMRGFDDPRYTSEDDALGNLITLPVGPVSSVSSIAYRDEDGVARTWAASGYVTDITDLMGAVSLAPDGEWPETEVHPAAVTITWVAGFGSTAASVPEGVKQGIRLMLAAAYEDRAPTEAEMRSVKNLLRMYAVTDYPG